MSLQNEWNVLLIEDDDDHAKIISSHLKAAEENIKLARRSTLKEGVEYLSHQPVNALLLDLKLPDSNFKETLDKIQGKFFDVPLIALSSLEDRDLVKKMIHAGAQEFLCKSELSTELLIRAIFSAIERKKIEIALEESRHLKSQMVNASWSAIASMNDQGKITEFNPMAETTFGFDRESILGQDLIDTLFPDRTKTLFRKRMADFLSSHEPSALGGVSEIVCLKKDGTEFPAEAKMTSFKINQSYVFSFFIRDLTQQKNAAIALQRAKEGAEQASEAKSVFLANMSHEIRTPLGVVLGFSQLLCDAQVSPSERETYVATIKRNGELLSQIINDVLDLSKVEAGKLEIDFSSVPLQDIVDDLRKFLNLSTKDKGISFSIKSEKSLPETFLTDPVRLRQALFNIVGNAVKFTQQGSVDIQISLTFPSGKSSQLAFIVKDTGGGIDMSQADKLFSPFSQIDMSSRRQFGGTGLGLALSRNIARLLGGDLVLTESQLGKGSTFTLTIDPHQVKAPDQQPSFEEKKKDAPKSQLSGVKILIVDDSPDNRLLVSHFLRIAGATVEVASHGKEALDITLQQNFSVILMDLQMPGMDGYEATSRLRARGYQQPIIALTAHALIEERARCLQNGFNEHITKPIDRDTLVRVIHHFSKR